MNREHIETAAIENYLLQRLNEDERQQFQVTCRTMLYILRAGTK